MKILERQLLWVRRLVSDKSTEAVSRKYILGWNGAANVAGNLAGGNFLVGLYAILNVGDVLLGMLTTLIQLCNIFQILSPLLLNRFRRKKRVLLVTRIMYYSIYVLVIGIIPFVPGEDGLRVGILLAATALGNLINALAAPGYALLHIPSIPKETRADYFSVLSLLNNISIYVFILLGGNVVDFFRNRGSFLAGITAVRVIALAFAALEIYCHCHVHEFDEPEGEYRHKRLNLFLPLKNKQFMFCVFLMGFYSLFANIPGMYYSSYLVNTLVLPFSFLGIVTFLSVPCMLLFVPLWNRVIKKKSWFGTISISLILASLHYFMLPFVNSGNYKVLYTIAMVYYFSVIPGVSIVTINLPYYRLPEEDRVVFVAFYTGFNSFMAMLAFFIGSLFIAGTSSRQINIAGWSFQNKQYIMLVTGLLLLALGFVYRSIAKKEQL